MKKKLIQETDINLFNGFIYLFLDSPGIPLSANAPDLFRGFSFVAPVLINDMKHSASIETLSATMNNINVSASSSMIHKNDNNNNKIVNRNVNDKKVSAIVDNLLRITIIKTIPFENEYTIKEVTNYSLFIEFIEFYFCFVSENQFRNIFCLL